MRGEREHCCPVTGELGTHHQIVAMNDLGRGAFGQLRSALSGHRRQLDRRTPYETLREYRAIGCTHFDRVAGIEATIRRNDAGGQYRMSSVGERAPSAAIDRDLSGRTDR